MYEYLKCSKLINVVSLAVRDGLGAAPVARMCARMLAGDGHDHHRPPWRPTGRLFFAVARSVERVTAKSRLQYCRAGCRASAIVPCTVMSVASHPPPLSGSSWVVLVVGVHGYEVNRILWSKPRAGARNKQSGRVHENACAWRCWHAYEYGSARGARSLPARSPPVQRSARASLHS